MFHSQADPETIAAAYAAVARERAAKKKPLPPLTERLAEAMLEITGAGQIVDFQSLALRGFLRAELTDDNIAKARDKANARAVRQVS
ncbi:hypothetical protein GA830_12045 [Mesorhizobium sp. NBSH29]|uniref:hypothetical protein n=1 Tax=Mesorhizobium sp. NBSH29 TaxID=2654249 RepID=UPI0018966976|nr:hypothetical protein [Mesorhizobium sp. NBSH29]QPC87389.1 hypothetical protein GA830_12045 [Mesorhizobium sp. NBSH29]